MNANRKGYAMSVRSEGKYFFGGAAVGAILVLIVLVAISIMQPAATSSHDEDRELDAAHALAITAARGTAIEGCVHEKITPFWVGMGVQFGGARFNHMRQPKDIVWVVKMCAQTETEKAWEAANTIPEPYWAHRNVVQPLKAVYQHAWLDTSQCDDTPCVMEKLAAYMATLSHTVAKDMAHNTKVWQQWDAKWATMPPAAKALQAKLRTTSDPDRLLMKQLCNFQRPAEQDIALHVAVAAEREARYPGVSAGEAANRVMERLYGAEYFMRSGFADCASR